MRWLATATQVVGIHIGATLQSTLPFMSNATVTQTFSCSRYSNLKASQEKQWRIQGGGGVDAPLFC